MPSVGYTNAPEIAWVGLSEERAQAAGHEVKTGSSSFICPAAAPRPMEQAAGTIKVISDAKTDRILGVHAVGPFVSN